MNRKPKFSPLKIAYEHPSYKAGKNPSAFTVGEHTYITETRSYRLITPLFGGGVKAGVNDPITPIRASGIRGQLRFWWRAIRGGGYRSIDDLRAKEAQIWGSANTSFSSEKEREDEDSGNLVDDKNQENNKLKNIIPIQISVEISSDGEEKYPYVMKKNAIGNYNPEPISSTAPAYASFPLKPEMNAIRKYGPKTPINPIRNKIIFRLKITYYQHHKLEIQAALWAWEMFGGVGGRTRRGFGSITQCDSDNKPQNAESVAQWLKQNIKNYTEDISKRGFNWINDIPNIVESINESKFFCSSKGLNGIRIWNNMINTLQKFRHQRNQYGKKFGRNHWPEPDFIREITGEQSNDHQEAIIKVDKFPRAAFGLPIIFHFINRKDKKNPNAPRDPYDTTLVPKGFERFSSPLIIKIIQCADESYVGIALILSKTQVPNQLQLKKGGTPLLNPNDQTEDFQHLLTPNEAQQIKQIEANKASGSLLNQGTDILKAFLAYLAKELR
ncbi:type III-B CRISPR module RAMP protein Cmr1 [Herpetosiphon sp.]|uniref:CRISPR-associated RAMP protein, Cmr1 family n=1 Tax=Herpetosiphon aurantiacus (strain ATCC 23779 / DSM 785 / 114-95) TaxID=316274 RepID=A9AWU5_HERA2|nr:type III-B CRISPR module RAMP protein Cmr1 [Herpetosiphon sp.]ABX03346.1 CRISPR-associated RAMP protein, Cmr1 family [Herpetosiphon aurantiacus DSM 785]